MDEEVNDIQQEITLLSKLAKRGVQNIIHYYGCFLSGSKVWIVMDYCSGGSLRTLLKAGTIEEKYSAVIMREMLIALHYIHKEEIIHRDIKAANVLVSRDGGIQLCDFGVAAQLSSSKLRRTSMIGTPYWMAPEVIKEGSTYNQKADIWSLGVTLFEIVTGSPPYADQDINRAVHLIPRSKPTRLEGSQYTPVLKEFIAMCLDEEPEARASADDLLKTKLIKGTRQFSTSILKDLILRYQKWRQNNRNVRDSFLIPNEHAASFYEEEEEEESLSFNWDFESSNDSTPLYTNLQNHFGAKPNSSTSYGKRESIYSNNTRGQSNFGGYFSQEDTIRGMSSNSYSQNESVGNTISGSFPLGSFGITESHPLLDMFKEEGKEGPISGSPNLHSSGFNDRNGIPGDLSYQDNVTLSCSMSISIPPITIPSFSPPSSSSIQTSFQSYPSTEIDLTSLNILGSHTIINTSTPTGPGVLSNGPQFPVFNSSSSPINNPFTSASSPNLSALLNKTSQSSNLSKGLKAESQQLNSTQNSIPIHFPPPPRQDHFDSQMTGSFSSNHKIQISTSASDANLNSLYAHPTPPAAPTSSSFSVINNTTSQSMPSPSHANRQASSSSSLSPTLSRNRQQPVQPVEQTQPEKPALRKNTIDEADLNANKMQTSLTKKGSAGQNAHTLSTSPSTLPAIADTLPEKSHSSHEESLFTASLKRSAEKQGSSSSLEKGIMLGADDNNKQTQDSKQSAANPIQPFFTKENSKKSCKNENNTDTNIKTDTNTNTTNPNTNTAFSPQQQQLTKSEIQSHQQQQYNKQLQNLQQQQLKKSISDSEATISVPGFVPIPKDLITITSNTVENASNSATTATRDYEKHGLKSRSTSSSSEKKHSHKTTITISENASYNESTTYKDKDYSSHSGKKHENGTISDTLLGVVENNTNNNHKPKPKQRNFKSEKLIFPPLRDLNCNILLDIWSKEAVVGELGLQFECLAAALDILDKQFSRFIDE